MAAMLGMRLNEGSKVAHLELPFWARSKAGYPQLEEVALPTTKKLGKAHVFRDISYDCEFLQHVCGVHWPAPHLAIFFLLSFFRHFTWHTLGSLLSLMCIQLERANTA